MDKDTHKYNDKFMDFIVTRIMTVVIVRILMAILRRAGRIIELEYNAASTASREDTL